MISTPTATQSRFKKQIVSIMYQRTLLIFSLSCAITDTFLDHSIGKMLILNVVQIVVDTGHIACTCVNCTFMEVCELGMTSAQVRCRCGIGRIPLLLLTPFPSFIHHCIWSWKPIAEESIHLPYAFKVHSWPAPCWSIFLLAIHTFLLFSIGLSPTPLSSPPSRPHHVVSFPTGI